MPEFNKWLHGINGFHTIDPWNVRDLYEIVLDGKKLGGTVRFEICILRLQALDYKASISWEFDPKWVDTLFEVGTNTTWYDDIEMQIMLCGEDICDKFWIGTKLPTTEQIKVVRDRYGTC